MRIAAALSAVVLLAACSGDRSRPGATELPTSVLGVVWKEDGKSFVARLDPRSLEPLGGRRAVLGPSAGPSTLSPDGSLVAFGGVNVVHIVDLHRMRALEDIRVRGDFGAVAWPEPRRILLATGFNWGTGVEAVAVDPVAGRVVSRRGLGGSLQSYAEARDGLVLLLGPRSGIGPARLVSFRAGERIRAVRLPRVPAGFEQEEVERGFAIDHYQTPGLAVDSAGDRAFVVTGDDVIAEVDLGTLAVAYHRLHETTSLLKRLWDWIEPAAEAKGASDGSLRGAVWLGGGVLAVSGWDDLASFDDEGSQTQTTTAAGAALVETRTWSRQMLEPDASAVSVAGDDLLVYGSVWNAEEGSFTGVGLSAFDRSGERRFRLFESRPVGDVQVVGRLAYARFDDCRAQIVDLGSGRALGPKPDGACDRSLLPSAGQ